MTFAVFVDLDGGRLKLPSDPAVYLFETEHDASQWQFLKLYAAGEIVADNGCFRLLNGGATQYGAFQQEKMIEDWQGDLSICEYFHRYKVRAAR